MALAIFDLDNTLIAGDSDYLWGQFLVEQGLVNSAEFEAQNQQFYEDYQSGNLDIMAYQHFALAPIAHKDFELLNTWHARFMADYIRPIFLPKAQALVDQHKQQGDTTLIITATNSFVTRPIGLLYGIDNLIGTDPEIANNQFTGEVAGVPSFQQGKVTRLQDWLAQTGETLDGSYFYSDSHNDLPLLNIVSHPIAVDADATLSQHALANNWLQISLR